MNRFEIRDILNAHKEHFRALPTLAQDALNGIIYDINGEEADKHKATVAKLHESDQAAKKEKLLTEEELVSEIGKQATNILKKKAKKKAKKTSK